MLSSTINEKLLVIKIQIDIGERMRGKTNAVPITTLTIAINVSPIVAAQLNVQVSKSPGGIHVQIEGNYLRAANNHLDHLYLAGGGKKYAADIPYQHQILSPKNSNRAKNGVLEQVSDLLFQIRVTISRSAIISLS